MQQQKKAVVLLGGSGFVGRRLAAVFVRQGRRVFIVGRDPNRARAAMGGDYEYLASLDHLYDSIPVELVVNLTGASVGEGRWTPQRKQVLRDSRLNATRALGRWLSARRDNHPRLIVQASAVGYYGNGADGAWSVCAESAPPQEGVFVSDLCREWEEAARENQQQSGTATAVCRFGVVLGRGGGILPQLTRPVAFCVGKIGSGCQPLPWIHIEDLERAVLFLAAQTDPPPFAVYNFTANGTDTQGGFARAAAAVMRRPLLFSVPSGLMRLAMGEQADLVLGGQFVRPDALQAAGFQWRFPSLETALADLSD